MIKPREGSKEIKKWVVWLTGGGISIFLVLAILFYGRKMGILDKSDIPLSNFKEPTIEEIKIPQTFLSLPSESKMKKAEEYLNQKKYIFAYYAYRHIASHSKDLQLKAKATFFTGTLLCNFLNRPKTSIAIFKQLIRDYPKSEYIDDAYYYLGMIYLNENRLKEAIYYFTYLIDNFPHSNQLSNARFLAQKCAKMLVEQKEIQKKRGLDVSISAHFLPNNVISLLAFLSALLIPIVWILIGFYESEHKMKTLKTSRKIWIMMIILTFLLSLNYFANQAKSQKDYMNLVNALKESGINIPKK